MKHPVYCRMVYDENMNIEAIVREYIDKSIHLSLGTCANGKPWVCEVHFTYDEQLNLYFRSLSSTRHCQEITQNPNVAGNIVGQHQQGEIPHGIYFEGTAEKIDDDTERQRVYAYFAKRLGTKEAVLEDARKPEGVQFYKIIVANWYTFGKFDTDSVEKRSLPWNGGQK